MSSVCFKAIGAARSTVTRSIPSRLSRSAMIPASRCALSSTRSIDRKTSASISYPKSEINLEYSMAILSNDLPSDVQSPASRSTSRRPIPAIASSTRAAKPSGILLMPSSSRLEWSRASPSGWSRIIAIIMSVSWKAILDTRCRTWRSSPDRRDFSTRSSSWLTRKTVPKMPMHVVEIPLQKLCQMGSGRVPAAHKETPAPTAISTASSARSTQPGRFLRLFTR